MKLQSLRSVILVALFAIAVPAVAAGYLPSRFAPERLPQDRHTVFQAEGTDGLDAIVPGILYRKQYEGDWVRVTVTLYRGGETIHTGGPIEALKDQDSLIMVKAGEAEAWDSEGTRFQLKSGDVYAIPANVAATLRVIGKDDLILIGVNNVQTFGPITEMLAPYSEYQAGLIETLPTDQIFKIDVQKMAGDSKAGFGSGKGVQRRVWRMRYLDGWTFYCPSGCNRPFPMHSHLADKVVFNFAGQSKLWDEVGHPVIADDMQAFFAPFLLPHTGGLTEDTEMMIMSVVSPHREVGANANKPR